MESRVERVQAAQERDKARFEALAAEDRAKNGWKDLAIGVVTVAIGALAIWATMGAATPLVVGAGLTAGIGTAAYGASNAGEGIHNIQLGNAGDIHTKSYNRIRDTLFMGNDKLYHQVGGIFVTASSIMIPIGQTQSVVKGLTQFAIGEAGAYTAGQFAYHGTKLLGGSEEDAQTANFIGNIVGGYAVSSAASKFSLNKVKVDVEAPKYNREQILKNLEESRLARESSNFDQYLAKEKFQKTLMGMDPMDRQRYLQWHEYAESGIMVQDRVKLLSWERPVNSKLYLENKAVYDNPKYFDQLTGSENWPGQKGDPNIDGFVKGEYQKTTLSPGDKIDRFGSDYGHFFGNIGESKEMRAMSPNSDFKNYNQYEILMDLPVLKGKIAPWFDQPGGGIQFKLDPFFAKQIMSIPSDETAIIKKLIEFGYLRKL
ncbi:glycohydrolase toxin TNT-related protein [Streptococcus mitis]|uniref:TNT domain-containing protein n=3 Tax=Streptococcus mitis TaxID=28037 RepID=UPI0039C1E7FD